MNLYRKFESSKLGQFFLTGLWFVTIPLQILLIILVACFYLVTGKRDF